MERETRRPRGGQSLAGLRRMAFGPDYPPTGTPRPRWARLRLFAAPVLLLALVGLTAAAGEYLSDNRGMSGGTTLVLAVAGTAPAALAPYRPLWAWRLAFLAQFAGTAGFTATESWPWNPVQILACLFVLFLVAVRAEPAVSAWCFLLSLLPVWMYVPNRANAWGVTVLFTALLLVGDQVRRRRRSQQELAVQAERSELEQAKRAVLEERTRIARELHDVVAHSMSMIAVRAETAPYRLPELPDSAREEFTEIAGSARAALDDMRRLLTVLRQSGDRALTAPQPGLAELAQLVEDARAAGIDAVLAANVPTGAVGEAVALTAYRIVQEALANAARYAPGARVEVAVSGVPDGLSVLVRNGPARGTPERPARGGHGLVGMRERVHILGGELSAQATGDGGFAVTARLPHGGVL
ncbi:sensor histidine kinase [Catellatospora bangladeshensis]|uniref:histidine kinase n=1 Tax=Catellatospora bangladeshensis TaxID=310355 RepID=A0A8J3JGU7_9ACTN|nr:histidine kinase [Catellatospora bangladeshensis]GIF80416.1 two-component sensor histidine kinase [Catellatospora bangladeshensis]